MTTMYFETDVNQRALDGKCVAMVGYGSQGRGQALNLRDSGVNIVLGLREGGPSWQRAVADDWEPLTIAEAARQADIICMMCPDMAQPRTFRDEIEPNWKPGSTLLFAHGFCIHYGAISVGPDYNVVMLAPKGPGTRVREQYENGSGIAALVAVHQDATGNALELALAYGWGIGSSRTGILETNFAEETETDLFGEQTILCGGIIELIKTGWETLVDAGYQPEVAYFECLHEVKLIVDLIHAGGLEKMHDVISDTAAYGGLVNGKRIVTDETRQQMKAVLEDIQNGTFAKRWREESESGGPNFQRMREQDLAHPVEKTGRDLRKLFSLAPAPVK